MTATPASVNSPHPLDRTGLSIYALALGTHGHGHAFGRTREDESKAIIRRVCAMTPGTARILVDTAPRYGHGRVESWIGELGETERSRIIVASKGGRHIDARRDNQKDFSAHFLTTGLAHTLERLRMDRLFLFQLHNPSIRDIRAGEIFDVLESLRDVGLIEWYGVSIDVAAEGDAVLDAYERGDAPGLLSIQAVYSVLTKSVCAPMFARARRLGVAIIAREVLVRGLLTEDSLLYGEPSATAVTKLIEQFGRDQLDQARVAAAAIVEGQGSGLTAAAIGFALSHPDIAITLVGCNRLAYLDSDWKIDRLDPQTVAALATLPDLVPLSPSAAF